MKLIGKILITFVLLQITVSCVAFVPYDEERREGRHERHEGHGEHHEERYERR